MSRLVWITGEQIDALKRATDRLREKRKKVPFTPRQGDWTDERYSSEQQRDKRRHEQSVDLEIERIQSLIDAARDGRGIDRRVDHG